MAFTVTPQIVGDPNLVITDNTLVDGTWIIEARIINPQSNTYTFYWDYTKDTSTKVKVDIYYADVETGEEYKRYIKDLTTNTLIEDYFDIGAEGKSCVTEVVMRNEGTIKFVLTPDSLVGNDTFICMVRDNPLLGAGNR